MEGDPSQNRECNMEGVYSFQKCRGMNRVYNSSWEMYTVLSRRYNYFLLRGNILYAEGGTLYVERGLMYSQTQLT